MDPFVEQILQQRVFLQDEDYGYTALHVYVAGIPEPWEFAAEDQFVFPEGSGLMIVREDPATYDNEDVPEHVFRLNAIVVTQLV
jgi:hypothetical protein